MLSSGGEQSKHVKLLVPHGAELEAVKEHAVVWSTFMRGDYDNDEKMYKVRANIKSFLSAQTQVDSRVKSREAVG